MMSKEGLNSVFMATDINYKALDAAQRVAVHNKLSLDLVQTNLASNLLQRMKNSIDILIFNPVI